MTNDLSWESLLSTDPRLEDLLKAAKDLRSVRNRRPHFCANSYWLVGLDGLSYKQVVKKLAGDNLDAYKVIAEKIYYALPDCRDCFCKTIGLIPKKKRLIQIEKLFRELKKGADWCQNHPDDHVGHQALYEEAQVIFEKLDSLGVPRLLSEAAFIFSPEITPEFILQFEEDKNVN